MAVEGEDVSSFELRISEIPDSPSSPSLYSERCSIQLHMT